MRFRLLAASAVASLTAIVPAATQAQKAAPAAWVGTWATSPFDGDPWHTIPTVVDSTLREVVHTSIAGKALRVRVTNEFGKEPLRIDAATIAVSTGTSNVDASSVHSLTFNDQASIVIPPGAQALSDAVSMQTPAAANLAVSLFLPLQQVSQVSVHSSASQDNYVVTGNHVRDAALMSAVVTPSWYFLKGIDVEPADAHAAAIVVYGDSITDGAASTQNANHRWSDYLFTRLQAKPDTAHLAMLNEGIGGNCVLVHCVAENSLARFDRDVLAQAGVKYLIILESINDIGRLHSANQPDYQLSAESLEQGFAQLVARAHEHGIKVIGATVTPYQGAGYFTEKGEAIRQAVNKWILTSGVFDGTADFDKATADPAKPLAFAPQYDSGDHLHPKDAGYEAMAGSIDLSLFR